MPIKAKRVGQRVGLHTTNTPPTHHQRTTDTLPTHYRHTSDTLPTHHRHTTDTLPTHYQHTTDILPTQHRHITDTPPIHYRHTTDTLPPTHYRHATDTLPTRWLDQPGKATGFIFTLSEDETMMMIYSLCFICYPCPNTNKKGALAHFRL